jgi:hypothetical protein
MFPRVKTPTSVPPLGTMPSTARGVPERGRAAPPPPPRPRATSVSHAGEGDRARGPSRSIRCRRRCSTRKRRHRC